jgi:DNA-binding PadR family transcriptional regulator
LHGYRIKLILGDDSLRFWFPVEYASIYAVLRTLVKEACVRVVAIEREGQRPERTRYAITRAGRKHFAELLAQAWREPPSPSEAIQLALAARAELDDAEIEALLRERVEALNERLEALDRLARSAPAPEMVQRQVALTRADLAWSQEQLSTHGGATHGR